MSQKGPDKICLRTLGAAPGYRTLNYATFDAAAPMPRLSRRLIAGGRSSPPVTPPVSAPGGPVSRIFRPPAPLAGGRCSSRLSILSWPGKIALTALHSTTYAGLGFTTLRHIPYNTPELSTLALAARLTPASPLTPRISQPLHGRALISKVDHHRLSVEPSTKRALLSRSQSPYHSSTTLRLVLDSGCTRHVHPHELDLINRRPSR